MKINSLLNIISSIYYVAKPIMEAPINKASNIIEKYLVQGRYVSREEFEVAQARITKLQQKLDHELKINSEK